MTMTPNRTCSAFPLNVKIDKADVGLENVDNTSDLDKPISNAVRDYMDKTISDAETALATANTAVETAGTLNEQSRTSMESAKTAASDAASSALASETALSKAEVYAANAGTSADDASRYASNAKGSAESAAATLENAVTKDETQTVTGAKTFAGDTTVTGRFVTSGNAEMASLDIDTGTLTVGSGGTVEINGALTASNTGNVIVAKGLTVGPNGTIVIDGNVTLSIKSGNVTLASGTSLKSTDGNVAIKGSGNYFQGANHTSVLQTIDILTSKDIMESGGVANNLLHKSGAVESLLKWVQFYNMPCLHEKTFTGSESTGGQWIKCFSYSHDLNYRDGIIDVEVFTGHSTDIRGKTTLELLRRNPIPQCIVKDCCNASFVVGRLPADSTEDGACIINDGTDDTFYIYTSQNRPGYRVTFATIINSWAPASGNSEYNLGCCTRYAFDNYVTVYDEIVEALPTEYVSMAYPKVVTPKR